MSAALEASVAELIELSFLPDQAFLNKVLELVTRLRAESEARGFPMLVQLLDIARTEVEGRLSGYEQPRALSQHATVAHVGEEGDELAKLAERFAPRAPGPSAPPPSGKSHPEVLRLPRAIDDGGRAITAAPAAARIDAQAKMIRLKDRRRHQALTEKLRLAVEIRNFDTEQLAFSLAVLDGAKPRVSEDGSLRMTLPEMDVFLNALKAAGDGIEVTALGNPPGEEQPSAAAG